MFIPSEVKKAHELKDRHVILWEGVFYEVSSNDRLSPALRNVGLRPINPGLLPFAVIIHSDLNITTFAWN